MPAQRKIYILFKDIQFSSCWFELESGFPTNGSIGNDDDTRRHETAAAASKETDNNGSSSSYCDVVQEFHASQDYYYFLVSENAPAVVAYVHL
jgi:hypothetical protein